MKLSPDEILREQTARVEAFKETRKDKTINKTSNAATFSELGKAKKNVWGGASDVGVLRPVDAGRINLDRESEEEEEIEYGMQRNRSRDEEEQRHAVSVRGNDRNLTVSTAVRDNYPSQESSSR